MILIKVIGQEVITIHEVDLMVLTIVVVRPIVNIFDKQEEVISNNVKKNLIYVMELNVLNVWVKVLPKASDIVKVVTTQNYLVV